MFIIDGHNLLHSIQKEGTDSGPISDVGLCRIVGRYLKLIGQKGRTGLSVLPSTGVPGAIMDGGMPVNVAAGSGVGADSTVIAPAANTLYRAGLTQAAGGLNIVGSSGYNSALAQNLVRIGRRIKEEMP